jgi:predicted amidohydrolase
MKKEMLIAAVQLRFRPTVAENTACIIQLIQLAADAGVDAVLFPECAVTGYADLGRLDGREIEAALGEIGVAARRAACNVLVGSPVNERGHWYNSLLVFDRKGRRKFRYDKIHLTARDLEFFKRGNSLAFFRLDGIPCTAIICHERRFPELVRLPVMLGAQVVFHPNAGLDRLAVSKTKRRGKDGIAVRAFENQVFYVFANSVGPQGGGLWSAGDSKIVAPDSRVLALADNTREMMVTAQINLAAAQRKYAREALEQPAFLRRHWHAMLRACSKQANRR